MAPGANRLRSKFFCTFLLIQQFKLRIPLKHIKVLKKYKTKKLLTLTHSLTHFHNERNRLVTRGWRLVTIFFFFLSFSLSFFLFLFLLFPFISFIFFISFCLFYVFYPFYFFYLFFLYMKFLKSCIYTCLYDIFNARGLFAERASRAHKPEPAPP